MKRHYLLGAGLVLSTIALNSCNTPAGQGAAVGAGTGALVGGPIGAAVGAAAGAIVGVTVQESQAKRYAPPPKAGYPVAAPTTRPGFYTSPYTNKMYDLREVPANALVRDQDTNQLFRKP